MMTMMITMMKMKMKVNARNNSFVEITINCALIGRVDDDFIDRLKRGIADTTNADDDEGDLDDLVIDDAVR